MPRTVLLSIKPEYVSKILNGEKYYEFRRTLFRDRSIDRVIIYASSPVQKVVGEFMIGEILSLPIHDLWEKTCHGAGITWEIFSSYFYGKDECNAIEIADVTRYPSPQSLEMASGLKSPPQSFAYIKSAEYP